MSKIRPTQMHDQRYLPNPASPAVRQKRSSAGNEVKRAMKVKITLPKLKTLEEK